MKSYVLIAVLLFTNSILTHGASGCSFFDRRIAPGYGSGPKNPSVRAYCPGWTVYCGDHNVANEVSSPCLWRASLIRSGLAEKKDSSGPQRTTPKRWTGLLVGIGWMSLAGTTSEARKVPEMNGSDWFFTAGCGWTLPVKQAGQRWRMLPEFDAALYSYGFLDSADMMVNLDLRASLLAGLALTGKGDQGPHLDAGPQLVYSISGRPTFNPKATSQDSPMERRWRLQYQARVSTPFWFDGHHGGEGFLQATMAPRTIAWQGVWSGTWMIQAGIKLRFANRDEDVNEPYPY